MVEEPKLPYIMPRVTSAGFSELQPLMKLEEDFPRTFGEWEALWEDRRREIEGDGYKPIFVDVLPVAFAGFCKVRKIPCSWQSLGDFIAAKAGR